jgi:hypothetical protein
MFERHGPPIRAISSGVTPTLPRLALLVLLSAPGLHAQPSEDTTGNQLRHTFSRIAAIGVAGGTLVYSAGVWWVNDYRPFHYTQGPWFEDKLGIDKIGHMFTSYAMFNSVNDILAWGGETPETAFWWATGIAAFHGFAVEVGDGFSRYGFDYRDLTFNYIGLGFGMAREKVPFLKNFQLKWSLYYPLNRHAFKINALYDYHIYWMSIRVHDLLPEQAAQYWPQVIALAFGLGADDNVHRRTYCLSLDYNLQALGLHGPDLGLLAKLLNLFHLPAPGVKFSKGHPPEWQLLLLN